MSSPWADVVSVSSWVVVRGQSLSWLSGVWSVGTNAARRAPAHSRPMSASKACRSLVEPAALGQRMLLGRGRGPPLLDRVARQAQACGAGLGDQVPSCHVFCALKRECARSLSVVSAVNASWRIPSHRLVGRLDKAQTTMAKGVGALVASHALEPGDPPSASDGPRTSGRALGRPSLRRPGRLSRRTDLNKWLRERATRWTGSTSTHLIVRLVIAVDPTALRCPRTG